MSEEKKETGESTGFKVTDRRHFTSDGEVLPEGDSPAEEAGPAAGEAPRTDERPSVPEETPPQAAEPSKKEVREPEPPPAEGTAGGGPVDFTQLVMSLAGTAYHALGIPDPVTGEKGVVNPGAASQMIDLLAVLEEKTKGNLNPQEDRVLNGILAELRTLFVNTRGAL